MKRKIVAHFPEIGKKVKSFKDTCLEHKSEFQRSLSSILPLIRGGGKDECVLANILTKKEQSPFNSNKLKEWLDYKEEEINLLQNIREHRTIMVIGATGAGKSTLINGMINYILDVKWEDNFRFKLIDEGLLKSQAESQTSLVTAYEINYQDGYTINYSITIIDTPGFGDTRGIERDRVTDGISDIDAVCFVTQASLARLTHPQKYVFDSILSIFGKDIADNIQMLVTFADGQKPPVLEAINVSGVPCPRTEKGIPVHFKFNNSALQKEKDKKNKIHLLR
uniref:Uncharacterized protein n=1 Tax=Paramormyrops kingsleyae TaxID=1676925 RepID=A0A3B3SLH5_9TELE